MAFFDRLQSLCIERGKKLTPVLKELGLSTSLGTKWKNGTMPQLDTVEKLAAYFSVPVSYFTDESVDDFDESKLSFALEGEVRDMSDEEMQEIIEYARFIKERNRKRSEDGKK